MIDQQSEGIFAFKPLSYSLELTPMGEFTLCPAGWKNHRLRLEVDLDSNPVSKLLCGPGKLTFAL